MKENVLMIKVNSYPDGDIYYSLKLGHETIGSFDPSDGGYVIWNCRKVLPSHHEAIRQILRREVQSLRKRVDKLDGALKSYRDELELEGQDTPGHQGRTSES